MSGHRVRLRVIERDHWIGKRVEIIQAAGLPFSESRLVCADPHPEHIGKQGVIKALIGDYGSPEILLDDGTTIYGYECWWTPVGWKLRGRGERPQE